MNSPFFFVCVLPLLCKGQISLFEGQSCKWWDVWSWQTSLTVTCVKEYCFSLKWCCLALGGISVPLQATNWLKETVLYCERNGEDGYQLWHLFSFFLGHQKLKSSLYESYSCAFSVLHLLRRCRAVNFLSPIGKSLIILHEEYSGFMKFYKYSWKWRTKCTYIHAYLCTWHSI